MVILVYAYKISHRLPVLNATSKRWHFASYFVRCCCSCHCPYTGRVMCFIFLFISSSYKESFLSLPGSKVVSVHVIASFISLLRTSKFLLQSYVKLYHKIRSRKKYESKTDIYLFCEKQWDTLLHWRVCKHSDTCKTFWKHFDITKGSINLKDLYRELLKASGNLVLIAAIYLASNFT